MTRQFSGEPTAEWITDPNAPDRNMRLTSPFWFRDSSDKQWDAPLCFITDGASIPRALWALVGSPFTGDYRRAAIVHDKACDDADNDASKRQAADRMFYDACREGGCSIWDATVLYIGVRIGAILPHVPQWKSAVEDLYPRIARTPADDRIEKDFGAVANRVLSGDETDDINEIESRVHEALTQFTGINAANY